MLNNRGQSLILFVLIIPILLMIVAIVYDIGKAFLVKQELNNVSYLTIEYGLSIAEDDKVENMKKMIKDNIGDVSLNIIEKDNKIFVDMEKKDSGLFLGLFNLKIMKIRSSYVGYIENEKNIIMKNG